MAFQGSADQQSVAGGQNANAHIPPRSRRKDTTILVNPLAHLTDEELEADVRMFAQYCLAVDPEQLLRAARIAKDVRLYNMIAHSSDPNAGRDLPVQLTEEEKKALCREKDSPLSEKGMWRVILTVSLAAFLQGHVQSSLNGGALYSRLFNLDMRDTNYDGRGGPASAMQEHWYLGLANASPFLFAAVLGCPLALPLNHYMGRRGGVAVAAVLIFVSSLASAFAKQWYHLFGIRIVNGIGMGLKAVSTPILASETAVGWWRGTSILAWQLWVAFGIAIGFGFNLIFTTAPSEQTQFALIMGAPLVPSLALLVLVIWFCDESPRYLLRRSSPNYNPQKAYKIMRNIRHTDLQALRDIYLIQKSIDQDEDARSAPNAEQAKGLTRFITQYYDLFARRRLRNALISSSVVALAQQLCGINVLAFYSGLLFSTNDDANRTEPMLFSLGFGLVNFFFCLPAVRTIDTLGRRKWLIVTLPIMAVLMGCAAASFAASDPAKKVLGALFLFLFAAVYSPGLGPIPFTIASESFPLSHREAGAAFAIAVNLGFAGLLSLFWPSIHSGLRNAGALGLFSGLNIVAFVLVFLLLEETKRLSLEDLDRVFEVSKRVFVKHQVTEYLPWFFRRYFLWDKQTPKPSLYRRGDDPKAPRPPEPPIPLGPIGVGPWPPGPWNPALEPTRRSSRDTIATQDTYD